ncbi:unnamed protein product [Paramecium sonneborni]|nr:unnamed protein product [Paramecium sonneborni]
MCDTNACVWLNNTCKTRECSSFTIQKTCKYIPNYAQTQISICVWTEDKCQTLLNSNELSQDQCFQNTKGGYMWINDGCVSCHAYFLNIITMLIIFIFLG